MIESLANIRDERYRPSMPGAARAGRRLNVLHRRHCAIRKLVAPQLKFMLIFAHGAYAVNRYSIGRNPLKPACLID
jgi:hypothetical protein